MFNVLSKGGDFRYWMIIVQVTSESTFVQWDDLSCLPCGTSLPVMSVRLYIWVIQEVIKGALRPQGDKDPDCPHLEPDV